MGRRITIALSGVVGAGKSSAAKAIVHSLRTAGYAAEYVRFQEFTTLRALTRSARTSPEGSTIRGMNYQRRSLTVITAAAYGARTLLFRWRLMRWSKATVLVFDRYFYDSLVHYDLEMAGKPLALLLRMIPRPTIASVLLIQDTTVLERRAYSMEYAKQAAQAYAELPNRIHGLLVVQTDEVRSIRNLADTIVAQVLTKTSSGRHE